MSYDKIRRSLEQTADVHRLWGVILGMRHAHDILVQHGATLEHPAMRAVMMEIVTMDLSAVERIHREAEAARAVREQVRADLELLATEPEGNA